MSPTKNVLQQTCWFVLKTFYKYTCDCALIKKIENQQCVASSFNAFLSCKVGVFSDNGGYLLKANPLCTTSAVSVQSQVHL
ncbi:hypothetical protein AB205_0202940 [Aquarana catesbeiana]|uniref:Uncharacterized protein n=1 Tax=Aquarana catesbeiana TaxID=8400 RepID=A0A2G9SJI7_AQUCT|nr:hypothetical protein AB205_0202940 [Aquarana catesbeiana]